MGIYLPSGDSEKWTWCPPPRRLRWKRRTMLSPDSSPPQRKRWKCSECSLTNTLILHPLCRFQRRPSVSAALWSSPPLGHHSLRPLSYDLFVQMANMFPARRHNAIKVHGATRGTTWCFVNFCFSSQHQRWPLSWRDLEDGLCPLIPCIFVQQHKTLGGGGKIICIHDHTR